jgi:hypothetical protein
MMVFSCVFLGEMCEGVGYVLALYAGTTFASLAATAIQVLPLSVNPTGAASFFDQALPVSV